MSHMKKKKKRAGTKKEHLTYEDRVKIEGFLSEDYSYQAIATAIKRSKSAVGYEVKKNGGRKKYSATKAERRARLKQRLKKRECVKVALTLPVAVRGEDVAARLVARAYRVPSALPEGGISPDGVRKRQEHPEIHQRTAWTGELLVLPSAQEEGRREAWKLDRGAGTTVCDRYAGVEGFRGL